MRHSSFIAGVLLLTLTAAAPAQRSIPLSLERMVKQAGVVVHGRVVATETGRDPRTGFPATWTTVEVRENFYGAPTSTVRYKQFGGTVDGVVTPTPDLPRLAMGEEVIILLYPPSKQAGFQSPVGMAQGIFRIKESRSGKRVTQAARTAELMKTSARAPLAPDRDGTYDFEGFAGRLRALVREVKP